MSTSRANKSTNNKGTGGVVVSLPVRGLIGRDYSLPFQVHIENAKNTAQNDPNITLVELPNGRINKIWIEFPSGCAGLAGLQLWRAARQIFPLIEGDWFIADGVFLPLSYTEILDSEPYTIEIRTYNIDDTYSHRLTVIIEMSGIQATPSERASQLLDYLGKE